MRVLLLANDCNPDWPSLPVVGYNACRGIAEHVEVVVATHVRNKSNIDEEGFGKPTVECLDNDHIAAPMCKLATLVSQIVLFLIPICVLCDPIYADPPSGSTQVIDDHKLDQKMNLVLQDKSAAGQVFKPTDLLSVFNLSPRRSLKLPSTQRTAPEDGEFYSRAVKSTLALFSSSAGDAAAQRGSRLGAAVVIDPSGIAITCFHAIRFNEPFAMVACSADGRPVDIRNIISIFPRQDLALLQLDGDSFDCLPVRTDAPPGTQVRLLGHPLGMHFFMTQGLIGRYEDLPAEGNGESVQPWTFRSKPREASAAARYLTTSAICWACRTACVK